MGQCREPLCQVQTNCHLKGSLMHLKSPECGRRIRALPCPITRAGMKPISDRNGTHYSPAALKLRGRGYWHAFTSRQERFMMRSPPLNYSRRNADHWDGIAFLDHPCGRNTFFSLNSTFCFKFISDSGYMLDLYIAMLFFVNLINALISL
ncbi:hypothetical protein CEXT_98881 [Caerostris extrusa]|uniref:Uncharacterized protein n=1 Tax=Caerostris extrusa TaxID=172846 RepID=A0AAV4XD43_CAEEX|nr:hypothetical protein CEXT_98881 [Caerostris extrusa]